MRSLLFLGMLSLYTQVLQASPDVPVVQSTQKTRPPITSIDQLMFSDELVIAYRDLIVKALSRTDLDDRIRKDMEWAGFHNKKKYPRDVQLALQLLAYFRSGKIQDPRTFSRNFYQLIMTSRTSPSFQFEDVVIWEILRATDCLAVMESHHERIRLEILKEAAEKER